MTTSLHGQGYPLVKTLEVDTRSFEIRVDSTGAFFTTLGGERIDAVSLKALEARVRKLARQKRVEVPVTLVRKPSWQSDHGKPLEIHHGTVTGIHASNNRTLFKDEQGKTAQISSYDGEVCRRLTDVDVARLQEAWQAKHDATEAWEALFQSYRVNEHKLLETAQTAAQEPAVEPQP